MHSINLLLPVALTFLACAHALWDQTVFSAASLQVKVLAEAEGDGWWVKEQSDSVCKAGSRHFAGKINVTEAKSIFFCKLTRKVSGFDGDEGSMRVLLTQSNIRVLRGPRGSQQQASHYLAKWVGSIPSIKRIPVNGVSTVDQGPAHLLDCIQR